MVHLQDVVKLHTFVLGHLGALLLACFGFDLRFALVAFDLVSDSIWCEGVGVGVGARGGSTWAGGDYLRGALGWERRANLRTTNKSTFAHTHTSSSHSTTSPWSPNPYLHCVSTPPCSARARFLAERRHPPHTRAFCWSTAPCRRRVLSRSAKPRFTLARTLAVCLLVLSALSA